MKLKLTDEQKKILSEAGKIYSQMAHASMTKEQRIARAKKASHARGRTKKLAHAFKSLLDHPEAIALTNTHVARAVDKSMDKN